MWQGMLLYFFIVLAGKVTVWMDCLFITLCVTQIIAFLMQFLEIFKKLNEIFSVLTHTLRLSFCISIFDSLRICFLIWKCAFWYIPCLIACGSVVFSWSCCCFWWIGTIGIICSDANSNSLVVLLPRYTVIVPGASILIRTNIHEEDIADF